MFDPRRRVPRLALLCLFLVLSFPLTARADRSGMQVDPAYMFEKAGNSPEAALYYHRALRGWKEFYMPLLWGESIRAGKRVVTPGRTGFPGLFFSNPCAKLFIDGKAVLPGPDAMMDPAGGVRADYGDPMRVEEGLHDIRLEFEIRSYDDLARASNAGLAGGQPCIRLYWSSEFFLREVVPASCLVAKE